MFSGISNWHSSEQKLTFRLKISAFWLKFYCVIYIYILGLNDWHPDTSQKSVNRPEHVQTWWIVILLQGVENYFLPFNHRFSAVLYIYFGIFDWQLYVHTIQVPRKPAMCETINERSDGIYAWVVLDQDQLAVENVDEEMIRCLTCCLFHMRKQLSRAGTSNCNVHPT